MSIFDDDSSDSGGGFRLVSIEFDDPAGVAHFAFGSADSGGPYAIEVDLPDGAPNIEQAIAAAAESAAADFRAWAKEAEDLAAVARAGRLRQLPAGA